MVAEPSTTNANMAKLGEYKLVRTVGEGTFGKVKRMSTGGSSARAQADYRPQWPSTSSLVTKSP